MMFHDLNEKTALVIGASSGFETQPGKDMIRRIPQRRLGEWLGGHDPGILS
jgi:hypothetical protein